ncbi:MAG: phosphatase PAP2 family protein [Phycisphaerales bacterium]
MRHTPPNNTGDAARPTGCGRPSRLALAAWGGATLALFLSFVFDQAAYHALLMGKEAVEPWWWYRIVRQIGSLTVWVPVAAVAGAVTPGSWRRRVRAGAAVLAAAALGGLLAEVLKPVIGRDRPLHHDGGSVFRPLDDRLSGGLGFPSSHAGVAFGGAWLLWRMARSRLPERAGFERLARSGWVWVGGLAIVLAIACGISRTLTGAHFLSDVIAGAMLGVLAANGLGWWITPGRARRCPGVWLLRPRRRVGPGPRSDQP